MNSNVMDLLKGKVEEFLDLPLAAQTGLVVGAGALWWTSNYYSFRWGQLSKPFNKYTTNEEAIDGLDLTGKIAVVTGSNNGIGKETVRVLVKQGCTVFMACRSVDKANLAKDDIVKDLNLNASASDRIQVVKLDLSSLASVEEFAKTFNAKNLKINYLINNAGIMALPEYKESTDGLEMQFATNHLGHFYLTNLLMPSLLRETDVKEGRLPRVITVSSTAHRSPHDYNWMMTLLSDCLKTKDFMGSRRDDYSPWLNYGISKACNILFTYELQRRFKNKLIAVTLHPGGVSTGLGKYLTIREVGHFFKLLAMDSSYYYTNMKPLACGASTTLRCVSLGDDEIKPAHYYKNCDDGNDTLQSVPKAALNDQGAIAAKLWELSETLLQAKGFSLS